MTEIWIPIIFGWLIFHRKKQLGYDQKPILVVHYQRPEWAFKTWRVYSKRLVHWLPKPEKNKYDMPCDFDSWRERE